MGNLTLFTSYTPGAGKTYFMLAKAMEQRSAGKKVTIGFIYGRHRDTAAILGDHGIKEDIPSGYSVKDIIKSGSDLVVMDEMGVYGKNIDDRHTFVYEDIQKILDFGMDVYASINLKKFAGINKYFREYSGIAVKKCVPDLFLEEAAKIFYLDRDPEKMREDYTSGNLFGERYMKTKIMNKNFRIDTLLAYRRIGLDCIKEYGDKTEVIVRN